MNELNIVLMAVGFTFSVTSIVLILVLTQDISFRATIVNAILGVTLLIFIGISFAISIDQPQEYKLLLGVWLIIFGLFNFIESLINIKKKLKKLK